MRHLAFAMDRKGAKISLGNLVLEEPSYGTSSAAIQRTSEDQPKYIRITDFDDFGIAPNHEYMTTDNYSDKHLLRNGDILFARSGATVGKTYYYDGAIGSAVFAGYCIRFRFDESKVYPKFIYWCTKTETYSAWVKGIQRPSGQPNINKEEFKSYKTIVPPKEIQFSLMVKMNDAEQKRENAIQYANLIVKKAREQLLSKSNISFSEYHPSTYSYFTLGQVKKIGFYCNPHSAYLNDVYTQLCNSSYYAGALENYVDINPSIKKSELRDSDIVSFVPMPAVKEKTNQVVYEKKKYGEVKTGFTPFQRGDLLWAKITPCMQNGKSFLSDNMPTEYGFGSTEFHVLRPRSEKIYMPYLWILLSDKHILEAAQGMFSGSAGQQRVTEVFLKKLPIVFPSFSIQKELADEVFHAMEKSKLMIEEAEREWSEAKAHFEKELLGES